MEIGAQLYTVRDFCKSLEDFSETLKKVADIGYKYVQVSGTCEFDALWLKNELEKNSLKCVLTHTATDKLKEDSVKVAKDHDVFDCEYVGLGWYDFREDDDTYCLDEFFDTYKDVAKNLKDNGKYFMYHNHDGEFKRYKNKLIIDWLAETIPESDMGFTLDTYWIQAGGADPAFWIEKFSGRVPCIHLKDFSFGRKMSVIGEGNINFDRVFKKAEAAGTKYMLVEQDDCNGEDPFVCLKRSYEYLRACGFR